MLYKALRDDTDDTCVKFRVPDDEPPVWAANLLYHRDRLLLNGVLDILALGIERIELARELISLVRILGREELYNELAVHDAPSRVESWPDSERDVAASNVTLDAHDVSQRSKAGALRL